MKWSTMLCGLALSAPVIWASNGFAEWGYGRPLPVRTGSLSDPDWGYINEAGDMVIEPRYKSAFKFRGEYAFVTLSSGQSEIIDDTGDTAFSPDTENELAAWTGHFVALRNDNDRIALVAIGQIPGAQTRQYEYENVGMSENSRTPVQKDGKWGYINDQQRSVIKCQYESARAFSNKHAQVANAAGEAGLIGKDGSIVVPLQYDFVGRMTEDRTARIRHDGKWWYVNDKGERLGIARGGKIGPMNEGLAPVQFGANKAFGYVDRSGAVVIRPRFSSAGMFNDGLAPVRGQNSGYINNQGDLVIQVPNAEKLGVFDNGLARVWTEQWRGVMNRDGQWVWRTESD
jgi:hypothetical protein